MSIPSANKRNIDYDQSSPISKSKVNWGITNKIPKIQMSIPTKTQGMRLNNNTKFINPTIRKSIYNIFPRSRSTSTKAVKHSIKGTKLPQATQSLAKKIGIHN